MQYVLSTNCFIMATMLSWAIIIFILKYYCILRCYIPSIYYQGSEKVGKLLSFGCLPHAPELSFTDITTNKGLVKLMALSIFYQGLVSSTKRHVQVDTGHDIIHLWRPLISMVEIGIVVTARVDNCAYKT